MKNLWRQLFASLPLLLLLLAITSSVLPTSFAQQAERPGRIDGDWVVTGNEVVEGEALTLSGNLRVEAGGSLTLRRSQLVINNDGKGQFGILVRSGGSLSVIDKTVITSAKAKSPLTFVVERNGGFVMRDSELHYAGWGAINADYDWRRAGLVIEANDATIEGNLFSHNFVGVLLRSGSGANISNNRFIDNVEAGVSINLSSGNRIVGNAFSGSTYGVRMLMARDNVISGNTFDHHGETGIAGFNVWNSEITDNRIDIDNFHPWKEDASGGWVQSSEPTNGWTGIYLSQLSGNNRVMSNVISGGVTGITTHYALNSLFAGNTMTGFHEFGLYQAYSNGNVISGNTLRDVGGERAAIALLHSSENQYLNNSISATGPLAGILAFGSSVRNRISGNEISSADAGIMLHTGSNENIVTGNSVNAKGEAIVVLASSGNLIHHNSFSGESSSYDDGENRWDDGSVGNYWGSSSGAKTLNIAPKGVDHQPLTKTFGLQQLPVPTPPEAAVIDLNSPELGKPLEVTSDTTVEGQTINASSVVVANGGRLTLRNATLLINGVTIGIEVRRGGELVVEDSTIAPGARWGGGYTFKAFPGSKLEIRGSAVKGSGFLIGGEWQGLDVHTDGVVIENSVFTDTASGLFLSLDTKGHRIVGNTFIGGYRFLSLVYRNEVVVTDNRSERALRWGIEGFATNSTVKDNVTVDVWYEKKVEEQSRGRYFVAGGAVAAFVLLALLVRVGVKRLSRIFFTRLAR